MPTQNLLMLLLLLMLMMRIIKLTFGSDFEHKVWSIFEIQARF